MSKSEIKNGDVMNNSNQLLQEKIRVLEIKNKRLRTRLENTPTTHKKLVNLLNERRKEMLEDWYFFDSKKRNGERLRNCVNKKWKEYPVRENELKNVIELIENYE